MTGRPSIKGDGAGLHRQGRVRLINPGALYRAATKTVAVLNTQTDELRFLTVSEGKR